MPPRKALSDYPPHIQDQIGRALHGPKRPILATPRPESPPEPVQIPQTQPKAAKQPLYPFTLWLEYRVPSLNTVLYRSRWSVAQNKTVAKKALYNCLRQLGASYPTSPKGMMHVLITCYVIRLRDADNSCCKFLIDQMRYAALLKDDDPGSMELTVRQVRVSKRKLEGTKVVLAEALP